MEIDLAQKKVCAPLAAALITASGRPHSVEEVVTLMRDLQFSFWPVREAGRWQKWAEETKPKLAEPHVYPPGRWVRA